ncbi:hypothetical protein F2Q68_00044726 [Brassica cretica]|uniref:Secreted protein n=2 Tax=Brassica cretica TaxID=69181 RepID=A0ABQ7AUG6_BRACR|nr:hypothetical protein F2Q68_00044726 [Brassica cretica]KAF3517769.1 hypothetical protein DY000_02061083 [Brassica cretica]
MKQKRVFNNLLHCKSSQRAVFVMLIAFFECCQYGYETAVVRRSNDRVWIVIGWGKVSGDSVVKLSRRRKVSGTEFLQRLDSACNRQSFHLLRPPLSSPSSSIVTRFRR